MPLPKLDENKTVVGIISDIHTGQPIDYFYEGDSIRTKEQSDYYQMNPNLYWAGTDWSNVKYLSYWFKK